MNPNPTVASRRGLVHFLGLHSKQDLAHGPAQRPRGRVPWLLLIVGLGLGLRTFTWVGNPPLWHDEAAQIYNVLHLDLAEVLGPLYYSEACPPLFLVAEKAVVAVLNAVCKVRALDCVCPGVFLFSRTPLTGRCLASADLLAHSAQ